MVDEAMLKVLDDAAERLMRNKSKWAEFVAESALAGASHAQALDDATREAFKTFHDRPTYTVDGDALDGDPRLTVTGIPSDTDEYISKACAKVSMDLRMCEHCHTVARKMGCCKSCNHATYCSAECQTAAWKAHKPLCRDLVKYGAELGALGRTSGKCLFYPPPFFRETLRPDRPRLCQFWLEALVASLEAVACLDAYLPLAGILAYLWKYTWVCFPKYLRTKFVANLRPLHAKLAREEAKDAARMSAAQCAEQRQCRYFLLMCDAVAWMAKGDRELSRWQRGGSAARQLPRWRYHGVSPLAFSEGSRTYRYLFAELLERQHVVAGAQQLEHLPPDTGCVLLSITPRGRGLVSSAYGQMHARETCVALLQAWTAARDQPEGWRAMQDEVVPLYGVGAFAVHGAGSTYDPRYAVIRQEPDGALGRPLGDYRAVAELLTSLRGVGARRAPVFIADLLHVETRDCIARMRRDSGADPDAKTPAVAVPKEVQEEVQAQLAQLGPVVSGIGAVFENKRRDVTVTDVVLPRQ